MSSIPSKEYYAYKSAIEKANSDKDKEALKSIQKQLITKYGYDHKEVKWLLGYFRYSV